MTPTPLTGLEKVAVLLKSLPAPVVETILRQMDTRQAGVVNAALAKLENRPDLHEIRSRVLDETLSALADAGKKKPQQEFKPEVAPAIATPASRVDIRLAEEAGATDALLQLAALPADLVATALQSESAKTISLLMDRLEVEVAGNVYKRLDPAKRKEVSALFTATTTISDHVLQRIGLAVLQKCQTLRESAQASTVDHGGRENRMAAFLRNLERTDRMETIAMLEASDVELAARVKQLLYHFDDILRMENVSIRKLLTEVETRSLANALVGADTAIQDKVYANLSKRAQESLREEIDLAGKVPKSKVSEARQQIADAVQRLDQRGELAMIEA